MESKQEDANKCKGSFPFRYNDELENLFTKIIKRIRKDADLHLLLEKPLSPEPSKTESNAEVDGITSNLCQLDLKNKHSKRDKNLEAEIEKTVAKISVPTRKANIIARTMIKELETDLKTHNFTGMKWTIYGSYENGLCTIHSDTIDISCGNDRFTYQSSVLEYGENTPSSVRNLVLQFNEFFKVSSLFRVEEFYEDARVPIIKLFHTSTQKKVNITFFNELGSRNVTLTKLYLNLINPNLQSLILYLKDLTVKFDLCGKFKITTHVLFWLVVYFLQEKGLLPSVKDIREAATEKQYVSGWNCSVPDKFPLSIENQLAVSSLLVDFFLFYNNFNFLKYVISPYHGCAFSLEEFQSNLPIPKEAVNDEGLQNANSFFIQCFNMQDPVMLNRNLTDTVHIGVVNSFVLLCYRLTTDRNLLMRLPKKLNGYGNQPPNDFKRYATFNVFLRDIPTSWWADINHHVRGNVRKMMEMIFKFELYNVVEQNIPLIVPGKDGCSENTSTVIYFDYRSTRNTWKNEYFLKIVFGGSKSSGEPGTRNFEKSDELVRIHLVCKIRTDKKMVYVFVRSNDRMAKFLHKHFGRLLLFIFELRCN